MPSVGCIVVLGPMPIRYRLNAILDRREWRVMAVRHDHRTERGRGIPPLGKAINGGVPWTSVRTASTMVRSVVQRGRIVQSSPVPVDGNAHALNARHRTVGPD